PAAQVSAAEPATPAPTAAAVWRNRRRVIVMADPPFSKWAGEMDEKLVRRPDDTSRGEVTCGPVSRPPGVVSSENSGFGKKCPSPSTAASDRPLAGPRRRWYAHLHRVSEQPRPSARSVPREESP